MQNCVLCGSVDSENPSEKNPSQTKVECPVCGRYLIDDYVKGSDYLGKESTRKHLLIGLIRQASDAGRPLTITAENINQLLDSTPKFSSPLDNLNLTLILLMQRQKTAYGYVEIRKEKDFPLVYAHNADEFIYLVRLLEKQGLIEFAETRGSNLVRITPQGWTQGLDLLKAKRNSNRAFIAMSFAPELNEAWKNGIEPALKETGFIPYRVDQEEYNEKIDDRIISGIRQSGLVVADFTGHRQGVYFEAGFAMGLSIPVICTCRDTDITAAHFDTRQYNHIIWTNPVDLQSKLSLRISATIPKK
jgi:nucleoside 2-deoxyribosyltransferase